MSNFVKLQAAANDFIVFWQKDLKFTEKDYPALAKKLCRRNFNIGADGLIVLTELKENYFKWWFYNNDGSSAEMCGNAIRAVGNYLFKLNENSKIIEIETLSGIVKVQLEKGKVSSVMPKNDMIGDFKEAEINYAIFNTGVPHAVVQMAWQEQSELYAIAKKLRYPKALDKNGANISFWDKLTSDEIKVISFERGVEDFTLACGTGAAACALDFFRKENKQKVKCILLGGEIDFVINESQNLVQMGMGEIVFNGKVEV